MHHIALRVPSVTRAAEFYTQAVGLVPMRETASGSIWLRAGESIVMIEERLVGEPRVPEGTMELHAFAIAAGDRQARRAQLESFGVTIESETAYSIYFRDPEGRRLALSHYPEPAPAGTTQR